MDIFAQAKVMLGTNDDQDAELHLYTDAVTPVLVYLGCDLDSTDYTDTFDGGACQIMLHHTPVISVTSVIESWGSNYTQTLTATDLFSGSGSTGSYCYSIELATGVLTRRAAGVAIPFAPGTRNVQVAWTAGFADIPANLTLAALELVRGWWQIGEQGNRPAFGDSPEMAFAALPPDVRVRVREMLADHLRLPGIG